MTVEQMRSATHVCVGVYEHDIAKCGNVNDMVAYAYENGKDVIQLFAIVTPDEEIEDMCDIVIKRDNSPYLQILRGYANSAEAFAVAKCLKGECFVIVEDDY